LTDLLLFQPNTGRDSPTPTPGQPAQGAPPSSAPPAGGEAPSAPGFSGTTLLLFLLPILLIFFMTRSQNKKQKDLESNLKVGERVITRSGLVGRIIELNGRAKVEIAPGVNVVMLRSAIEAVDPGEAKPAADKAKVDDKDKDKDKKEASASKAQDKKA
jgi:preprotein translocase subunit YajC